MYFLERTIFSKLTNGDEFQSVTTAYYTDEYEGNFVMNKEEAVQA